MTHPEPQRLAATEILRRNRQAVEDGKRKLAKVLEDCVVVAMARTKERAK